MSENLAHLAGYYVGTRNHWYKSESVSISGGQGYVAFSSGPPSEYTLAGYYDFSKSLAAEHQVFSECSAFKHPQYIGLELSYFIFNMLDK